ncbi:MAG: 6-phosphogluconolactonase [Ardenticatenaceae bacterium]|nr:6-phosphogluconolactonase [Ardenticatenaceae bacterium]MCB9445145.1 6-phosphogluconolactonase [Ardenticatenaceae bacterium]
MTDIRVFKTKSELSQAAARLVVAAAQGAVAVNDCFLIALSGGGTPVDMFRLLSLSPHKERMPWEKTHIFWGDERLVPPDDSGSNYGQAADILLRHVPIPAANIHRVLGETDAVTAVADYTAQLKQLAQPGHAWPRFDLVIMGMGSDGHTASLFPGPISADETQNPVMAVTADYDGRPAHRVTLTPMVFNDAHHILFMLTGENKANAVRAVTRGPLQPGRWPAQRICPHNGQITWLMDKAAASRLG